MTERLFVYGTLAPGRSNAHELAGVPGTWTHATVRGHLLPEGWGAALGYPALVPDDDGPTVAGLVLASDALAQHWDRLDAFEGDGYDRVVVRATTDDGSTVAAWVYVLRPGPGSPHQRPGATS
ncbi:gamma-glutamylcyclotransferase [Angustibacter peucedani]